MHDLTQKSSSILPNTHFKLKIVTDASRPRKKGFVSCELKPYVKVEAATLLISKWIFIYLYVSNSWRNGWTKLGKQLLGKPYGTL